MPELDLIPVRYSGARSGRRWFFVGGAAYMALAILILGYRLHLDESISETQRYIESLEADIQRAEAERAQWMRLTTERSNLHQRLTILEGLRGGIAAKDMFMVVDRAIDERIWFRSWSFRRAGEVVDSQPGAVETGYFIVLPKSEPDAPERAWRLETHMEIFAESEDHSSLARFVRGLSQQPSIENARILNTRRQGNGESGRIGFELALLVRSER